MHSLLEIPRPKLARLEHGLTSSEHQRRWKRWLKEGYDGIEVTIIGGAFGPTWPRGPHGLDFLSDFQGLKALAVNVSSLDSLEPLSHVAGSLESLSLGGGEQPLKTSCRPIAHCHKLRSLSLARVPKDLDAIAQLTRLEDLSLLGFTLKSFDIIGDLKQLKKLWIGFGSVPNIDPISGLRKLKSLELLKVREVDDLAPLSRVVDLQYLAIGDMKQITSMPDCSMLKSLRRVYLDTMNGISDLSGLVTAPRLEDLIVINSKIEAGVFDSIIRALRPNRVTVGLASRKAEVAVEAALGQRSVSLFGTDDEKIRLL